MEDEEEEQEEEERTETGNVFVSARRSGSSDLCVQTRNGVGSSTLKIVTQSTSNGPGIQNHTGRN